MSLSIAKAPRGRGTAIILFLSLGGLSFAVLQSLVAPTLGTIGADLGVATTDASWVLTAYLLSAIFGIGAGVGIVAAGPIVEALSWHWLFWLPAVLVAIALLGAIFGIPESPLRTPGRLDVLGTAILTVGLVGVLLAISEGQKWGWSDGKTIGLLVLGAIALVVFVLVELRLKEPLIDVRLFAHRGVWTAHVVALAFGFAMFGTFILVPTLLQLPTVLGYGFGFTVTLAFLIPASGHGETWQILVSGVLTGIGIGMALAACSNAIVESVPAAQTGEAISANTVIRTVGSSVGTAVIAALLASNVTAQGAPTDDAFTVGFWVSAGVGVLAILAALAAPSLRARRREAAAAGVTDFAEREHPAASCASSPE